MTQASSCRTAGSWLIGKNVPENSVIGMTTSRKITLKPCVVARRSRANAVTSAANARPVSTAAGERAEHRPRPGHAAEQRSDQDGTPHAVTRQLIATQATCADGDLRRA